MDSNHTKFPPNKLDAYARSVFKIAAPTVFSRHGDTFSRDEIMAECYLTVDRYQDRPSLSYQVLARRVVKQFSVERKKYDHCGTQKMGSGMGDSNATRLNTYEVNGDGKFVDSMDKVAKPIYGDTSWEIVEYLDNVLKDETSRDAAVFRLSMGNSLTAIGDMFNISRERVRQIVENVRTKLRAKMAMDGLTLSDLAA